MTDLIVTGWVDGVELGGPGQAYGNDVSIHVAVDRIFKGPAVVDIAYFERGVISNNSSDPDDWTYFGGDGSCATLRGNPMGKYALVQLSNDPKGGYNLLGVGAVYVDHHDDLQQTLKWLNLEDVIPTKPPASGAGGSDRSSGGPVAATLLLVAGGAAWTYRRRSGSAA